MQADRQKEDPSGQVLRSIDIANCQQRPDWNSPELLSNLKQNPPLLGIQSKTSRKVFAWNNFDGNSVQGLTRLLKIEKRSEPISATILYQPLRQEKL